MNNSAVQDLINITTRENFIPYGAPRYSPAWNDILLTTGFLGLPGGWYLFILFYGFLFIIFWICSYYFLRGYLEKDIPYEKEKL